MPHPLFCPEPARAHMLACLNTLLFCALHNPLSSQFQRGSETGGVKGTDARHAVQMGQARLMDPGFSFDALGGQGGLQGDTDMADAPAHLDLPKGYFGGAPGSGGNPRWGPCCLLLLLTACQHACER